MECLKNFGLKFQLSIMMEQIKCPEMQKSKRQTEKQHKQDGLHSHVKRVKEKWNAKGNVGRRRFGQLNAKTSKNR